MMESSCRETAINWGNEQLKTLGINYSPPFLRGIEGDLLEVLIVKSNS